MSTEEKEYVEQTIICPQCGSIEKARVQRAVPFDVYIHECSKCKYVITESDWNICEESSARLQENDKKK